MTHNIVLHFMFLERSFKLEIKTKDELNTTLDEIMSRLSVIEQSSNEKTKDEDKSKEDKTKDKESEVESVDEIEKLLNA